MRGSLLNKVVTATRAGWFCLDDKQDFFGWREPSNGLYLPHAVRTQRIEPYAILCHSQVLLQLGLQEHQFLSGQEELDNW